MFCLGLEPSSILACGHGLILTWKKKILEAGMKYILSSAFFFRTAAVRHLVALRRHRFTQPFKNCGSAYAAELAPPVFPVLIFAGFGFAISAVLFHLWDRRRCVRGRTGCGHRLPPSFPKAPSCLCWYRFCIIFPADFGSTWVSPALPAFRAHDDHRQPCFALRQQNMKRFLAFLHRPGRLYPDQ